MFSALKRPSAKDDVVGVGECEVLRRFAESCSAGEDERL
jgi:hypothetical protein